MYIKIIQAFQLDYNLIINIIFLSLKEIKYPIFPKDLLNYLKKSPIYFKGIFPNS